jgi:hypothetical protein
MRNGWLLCGLLALGLAAPLQAADEFKNHPGYVDGSRLLSLADDDTSTVEVSLNGAILRALISFDPELKQIAAGLESIHAIVLDFDDEESAQVARGGDLLREIEKSLVGREWQMITKIKDEGTNVSVLVQSDAELIGGLVVLISGGDGELVFANIAGDIDLEAIAKLGEKLDIPGLEHLDEGDD